MRAFIAIKAPGLENITEQLKIKGVRIVKEFHLTLKFLGEIDEKKSIEVKKAIESIKFDPYDITTTSIGIFDDWGNIRTVWLGLKDDGETKKIYEQLEEELAKIGFRKEKREFEPHITIARVKFVENKKEIKEKIQAIKAEPITFKVERLFFIKSELKPEGPVYNDL